MKGAWKRSISVSVAWWGHMSCGVDWSRSTRNNIFHWRKSVFPGTNIYSSQVFPSLSVLMFKRNAINFMYHYFLFQPRQSLIPRRHEPTCICTASWRSFRLVALQINGLMQKRRNSIVNTLDLRLLCTKSSILTRQNWTEPACSRIVSRHDHCMGNRPQHDQLATVKLFAYLCLLQVHHALARGIYSSSLLP